MDNMKPRDLGSGRPKPGLEDPLRRSGAFMPYASQQAQPLSYSQQFMPFAAVQKPGPPPLPQSSDFEAAEDPLLDKAFVGGKPGKLEQRVGPVPAPVVIKHPEKPVAPLPNPNPTKFTELSPPNPDPIPVQERKKDAKCGHAGPKHKYTCPVPCSVCAGCLKRHIAQQVRKVYKKCVCGRVIGLKELSELLSA